MSWAVAADLIIALAAVISLYQIATKYGIGMGLRPWNRKLAS
jgi:hypothetical protein